ncbi:MAG: DUF5666 domain-containing protein, partial [Anaerolineae bacterium]|nr:DUF5666 domain-containing protein [Anaerolineae bacterium]
MIEQDLLNAFNDSIDRLAAGQTLDDCLRAYPQYANQLRPMLNTGRLAHSAAPDAAEIAAAQARVRQRILSMTQPPKARPRPVLWQAATLAASLALVFLVTLTGSAALAQNSLPGDILYGMKILTEDVRLAFSGESTTLKGEFNERRIDEIRQLTAARRPAEVAFTGDITAASGNTWEIAGLPVTVTADTIGANDARVGETVKVTVATDDQGQIIAKAIEIETHIEPPPEPTLPPTSVPTRIPVTQTSIPTLTLTPSNTPTMTSTPTETATPTSTSSPTITLTPTNTPTMTVTFTPSPT